MLNRCVLVLVVLLLAIRLQAEARDYPNRTLPVQHENTLRILVEGDAVAAQSAIEELRQMGGGYGIEFTFANSLADSYEARIIVTVGTGTVSDPFIFNHLPTTFAYSSAAVLTPESKTIFTISRSSITPRAAIALVIREVIKNLYERYDNLKKKQHQDLNGIGPEKSAVVVGEQNLKLVQALPEEPGVYYKAPTGWIRFKEVPSASMKASGMGSALLTWGVSKVRMTQQYIGAEASLRITEPNPSFYIKGLAASKEDVTIVRLEKKKERREASVGSMTAFSNNVGYRKGDIREITFTRILPEIIVVTPKVKLAAGEYLLRIGSLESLSGNYDFGITPE